MSREDDYNEIRIILALTHELREPLRSSGYEALAALSRLQAGDAALREAALEEAAQWHLGQCVDESGPDYGIANDAVRAATRRQNRDHETAALAIRALRSTPEGK